jgi:hypothetical protein
MALDFMKFQMRYEYQVKLIFKGFIKDSSSTYVKERDLIGSVLLGKRLLFKHRGL